MSIVGAIICCLLGCAAHPRAGNPGQAATSAVDAIQTGGTDSSGGPSTSSTNPVESSTETGIESAHETGSATVPVLPAATEIVPTATVSSPAAESVPWPPIIIFGEILEAGTSEVVFGGIRMQVPAGFVKTDESEELLKYEAVRPETGGAGTVSFELSPSETSDAGEQLRKLPGQTLSEVGTVSIQGSVSAAIGLSVVGNIQTWILGVATGRGLVTATFSAPASDFDWFLFPQAVGSVQVQQ